MGTSHVWPYQTLSYSLDIEVIISTRLAGWLARKPKYLCTHLAFSRVVEILIQILRLEEQAFYS